MNDQSPQAKAHKLYSVLLSMGALATAGIRSNGFRVINARNHDHRGKGGQLPRNFRVPTPEEAATFAAVEAAKDLALYEGERIAPAPYHGNDLNHSRELIAKRRKEAKRIGSGDMIAGRRFRREERKGRREPKRESQ